MGFVKKEDGTSVFVAEKPLTYPLELKQNYPNFPTLSDGLTQSISKKQEKDRTEKKEMADEIIDKIEKNTEEYKKSTKTSKWISIFAIIISILSCIFAILSYYKAR